MRTCPNNCQDVSVHLAARYDDIFAPVHDRNGAIGMYYSQISSVETSSLEGFFGSLGVSKVLIIDQSMSQEPWRISGTNLLHHDIASCYNLAEGLSVTRDIFQRPGSIWGRVHDPCFLSCRESMALLRDETSALFQVQSYPRRLFVIPGEGAIGLDRNDDQNSTLWAKC